MRLCVVIPSTEYLHQAGARIRYGRLRPALAAAGHELDFRVSTGLDPDEAAADLYLFSKCYDAGAVLLAHALRARGRRIGIDLFDDMFSHASDSRLVHYDRWIGEMAPFADIILCSTPRMREIAEALLPGCPIHLLQDMWEPFDEARLARRIEEKQAEALATRRIKAAWFGIGDNPYFPVGLSDLAAFSGQLRGLEGSGFKVELSILTNPRALTPHGLALIESLPVAHHVSEWSVAAERDLLDDSLVSFLPVNAQNFSIAKSPNRAISAIGAGTQILSAGYPLYAMLDAFLYRAPGDLVADLERSALRVRRETIPALQARLSGLGDPEAEAAKLITALAALSPPPATPAQLPALINGRRSSPLARRIALRLGALSVSAPFAARQPDDDIQIGGAVGATEAELVLSEHAAALVAPAFAEHLIWGEDGRARLSIAIGAEQAFRLFGLDTDDLPAMTGGYAPAMRSLVALLAPVLPGVPYLLNEHDAPLTASLAPVDA